MPDAGGGKVAWLTMGEIVAKYVEIDEVLGGYAAFDLFFKDKAWDKIYRCLVGLRGAGATRRRCSVWPRGSSTPACARPRTCTSSAQGCVSGLTT